MRYMGPKPGESPGANFGGIFYRNLSNKTKRKQEVKQKVWKIGLSHTIQANAPTDK
jgi:hypothetical protein